MLKVSKISIGFAVFLFGFCLYAFLPNVVKTPHFLPQIGNKINFGLDINGGTHLLLKANTEQYITDKLRKNSSDIIKKIRSEGYMYYGFGVSSEGLNIKINEADFGRIEKIIKKVDSRLETKKNANSILVFYSKEQTDEVKRELLDRSIEIIRKRIDFSGTKEVSIYRQGADSIVLEVPGENNPEKIKSLINTAAKLTFHKLHPVKPILQNVNDIASLSAQGYSVMPSQSEGDGYFYVVSNEIEVEGEHLIDAKANITDEGPVVFFKFDAKGTSDFALVTANNIGKPLAIVLDGKVLSAPNIRSQISGGSGVISGSFTIEQVKNFALLLRSGALPATLDIIEEGIVGPTLGAKFLNSGIKAFFASFLFISAFMFLRYKKLGFVAFISLIYNTVLVLGFFSLIGVTLTIAGIAGLTLTLGMAVDANVLIFERILEDKKNAKKGDNLLKTISHAFETAFTAIADSNITTLISAFVIFVLTFGSIKGFAVALSVGVLCSFYSCVSISKMCVYLFAKKII